MKTEMTLDKAYEKIHGMNYKLNGVAGKLTVETIFGMTEVIHNPSTAGRRSEEYRKVRQILGDDYTTTVTADDEIMADIFSRVW
jgi:hypothetical protein